MNTVVRLYSNQENQILHFLHQFYHNNFENIPASTSALLSSVKEDTLEWEYQYPNPIEIADIIGAFIENDENYDMNMWISLDEDVFINVTEQNADEIIRYLYERFPY